MAYGRALIILSLQFKFLLILLCGDIELCPGPNNNKGIHIAHQNVRGLFTKRDIIADFLNQNNVNIFGITETLLTTTLLSSFVFVDGYNFERLDRKGKGGGTAVYIKENINYTRREDLENDNVEGIWLEVYVKHSKSFIVGIIYRPPSSSKHISKNFDKTFLNTIKKINREKKETLILGDFNCNYLDNKDCTNFKEQLSLNGLVQLIKEATRTTNISQTLIDLLLSNKPEHLCDIEVIPSAISDHDIIRCRRKIGNYKHESETITCRNYKKYDASLVKEQLTSESWNFVYDKTDPNSAWDNLKTYLKNVLNQHAPKLEKKIKGKISPWITSEIKAEMNKRDSLLRKFRKSRSETDHENFKCQRNTVNKLVKKAKSQYHQDQLNECANEPKDFWKSLKSIFPVKGKEKLVKSFHINNELTHDSKEIASGFNTFFANVASVVKSKAILLRDFVWKQPTKRDQKTYNTFRLKLVSTTDVYKLLRKLQKKKAGGMDDLPPRFLKDIAPCLAEPLAYLINLTFTTGIIPDDWKTGKITPVFKSGSKSNMDNYRPITVLPACAKIFEQCLSTQMTDYLENHNLLSNFQFGFRRKRNTELAATLFMDSIRKNMEKGQMTGAVFIDLSKAFDTLGHAHIIECLPSYGIYGLEREILINYLFNRKQIVSHNRSISSYQPVFCGVPQGSVLGPLLFLLAFNDIGGVLKHSKIVLYADDTVIYTTAKSQQEIENNLTEDFGRVANWMQENDLVTNMKKGKTECMLFGTKQRTKNATINIKYRYNSLSNTKSYKYLGIKLDQSLSLTEHFTSTFKKASGRMYLLKRIRPYLTRQAALAIHRTLIVSMFNYCSILTLNLTTTQHQRISSFERRANELIFGSSPEKIPKIVSLAKLRMCNLVFDCLNGNVCSNFVNYFELMKNQTRNNNKLIRLPAIRLESSRKSFYFNGAKSFNDLPINLREIESRSQFRSKLNEYFKN